MSLTTFGPRSGPAGDQGNPNVDELGGKGAGLVKMTKLEIAVPPGFVIGTSQCHRVNTDGWGPEHEAFVTDGLAHISNVLGRSLGDPTQPLLVSVRSGAPLSMPGMMDTVLNVGMTRQVAEALDAEVDGFGTDTWRRFVVNFADVVLGAPPESIDAFADTTNMDQIGAAIDALGAAGYVIPADPAAQVSAAAQAVFGSWNTERAKTYRRLEGIDESMGTAVVVQAMVFGNRNQQSGTGVAFTRDPSTAEQRMVGDFLVCAQGEDVVAGTHQTQTMDQMRERWPKLHAELGQIATTLEHEYRDLMDLEFTVDDGRLWLLQARRGKRTPTAALRAAIDMADDPTFPLTRAEAVTRVAHLLDDPPTQATDAIEVPESAVVTTAIGASPGLASGIVCTSVTETIERADAGEAVVLVRPETSPADVAGMARAVALVTTRGGMVSHAAVVAREWGIPAVVGCEALTVDDAGVHSPAGPLPNGTAITVDADSGRVLLGTFAASSEIVPEVEVLRAWRTEEAEREPAVSAAGAATAARPAAREITTPDVLRAVSLKGMADAETIASALGSAPDIVSELLPGLASSDLVKEIGERVAITPAGREEALASYAAEAGAAAAVEPHMEPFHAVNLAFKELMTRWQLRTIDGEQVPNDHTDPDYDAGVIAELGAAIDEVLAPLLDRFIEALPRLEVYRTRLATALAAVRAGDQSMLAHPLKDSYHTVWFELHEELIRLTGRVRTDE